MEPPEEDRVGHRIHLFDEKACRMPNARCRVIENGKVINWMQAYADPTGAVDVAILPSTDSLWIEWAPHGVPIEPRYPFRKLYHVNMGKAYSDRVQRRLHNIGFSAFGVMEENVQDFRSEYVAEPAPHSGDPRGIHGYLDLFHDKVGLLPRGTKVPPASPPGTVQQVAFFAEGDEGAETPTGPPPAPGPTTQGPVAPANFFEVVIDWGERADTFFKKTGQTRSSSHWLNVKPPPVALAYLDDIQGWPKANSRPIPLQPRSPTSVTARVHESADWLRLDFKLEGTVNQITKPVLAFQQLYAVNPYSNEFMRVAHALDDYMFEASGKYNVAPTRKDKGTRELKGSHPLLWHEPEGAEPLRRIAINTEFVDATELWWAVHPSEPAPRFLDPTLNPRPEHLRVLLWTVGPNISSGKPMIWFAVIPDAALVDVPAEAADLVFMRPPPGANSFLYSADAKGFAHKEHKTTTMWILARYLLSSRSATALQAAPNHSDWRLQEFAHRIQPAQPANPPTLRDPMDRRLDLRMVFRPVALQESLNQAKKPHLLFLPLGHDATQAKPRGGYHGLVVGGLKDRMGAAMQVLWSTGAIGRSMAAPPDPKKRKLWIAGHSAGNISMWQCLDKNAEDVERAASIGSQGSVLTGGFSTVTKAAAKRIAAGGTLDVFVLGSPDVSKGFSHQKPLRRLGYETPDKKNAQGKWDPVKGVAFDEDGIDLALRKTGAQITLIPSFDTQRSYFTLVPVADMNPFLRNLLGNYTDAELFESAQTFQDWNFLFFHEYAVYGGHGSTSAGAFRSFILDMLGKPNPRPPPP
ncbi:MAG: hypothetical protein KC731_08140 [Myxococcales bacterium]|nr:hypothetical protein [Myxococcales bacterium]